MFSLAVWKFYYIIIDEQPIVNILSVMILVLPQICARYEARIIQCFIYLIYGIVLLNNQFAIV